MVQKYEEFLKSRAKKQRAVMLDPGATYLKAGDREMVTAAKKPKKQKKFQEYTEGWGLPPKKRRKRSATDLSDPTGGADGVIKSTGTVGSKMGEKKEQTTRIRRTKEPRTGGITFKNAAKRRKKVLLEI